MTDKIRQAIIKERDRRGLTNYRLAQMVKGQIHPSAVYRFLNGQIPLNSIRTSALLDALGLKIVLNK